MPAHFRPNIIEIIWHDLGDWLGCYGRPDVSSPALDAFAAEGMVFENHFCPAPQCSPSRASLHTGLYPQSHGILELTHRGAHYRADVADLPQLLNNAGYHTALIGFQHERHDPASLTYAEADTTFANSLGQASELTAAEVADKASAWLRARRSHDGPFFLSVGFFDVHRVYGAHYDPAVAERLHVPGFLPDEPIVRRDMATLYDRIRLADAAVGRILAVLAEVGLADDTLVYFTTDHGPELPRAKMTLYDPGIKVALLMRWPGVIHPGSRTAALTSHVDVLPTLLQAAGVPLPDGIQGRSLLDASGATDAVFAQMTWHGGEYDPMRCVRTSRYKYIRNDQPGWPTQIGGPYVQRYGEAFMLRHFARPRAAEELYDLATDPWELTNLADRPDYAAIKADLSGRLDAWMRAVNDPLLTGPVPPADPARVGSGCVWAKCPPHDPTRETFRWAILRTRDFGEEPF